MVAEKVKIKKVQKDGYEIVYEIYPDKDEGTVARRVGYEIGDGYSFWKIEATYYRSLPKCSYYVSAKNKREAKKRFLKTHPWLDLIFSIEDTGERFLDSLKIVI